MSAAAGDLGALITPVPVIVTDAAAPDGLVRIDNTSQMSEDFVIKVDDFQLDPGGKPVFAPAPSAEGSASWYTFETTHFTLPSGTSRDVHFTVHAPDTAAPGDHVAALSILVTANINVPSGGSQVKAALLFQTRLQHRLPGGIAKAPSLNLTAVADPNRGTIHFSADIVNSGTTVLAYQKSPEVPAVLVLRAQWPFGADVTLEPKGFYVLPNSERIVTYDWTETPLFGSYHATFVLPAIEAGAVAQVTAETEVTFVSPLVIGSLGGGLVLLAGVAMYVVVRRRRRTGAHG